MKYSHAMHGAHAPILAVGLAAVGLAAIAAETAGTGSPEADLTDAVRQEVVAALDALLSELYVIPETAVAMRTRLRENLAAGAYAGTEAHDDFAAALTADLQSLSGDAHLRVMYGERLGAPQVVRRVVGGPGGDAERADIDSQPGVVVKRMPGSGGDGGVFDDVRGIPEAKMLPGNVGYVDIRLFTPREVDESDAIEAMATVEGADALIFDLRLCSGGSPDKVHLITSYLYPPEPFHLLTYYHAHEEPDSAYTLAEVPGRRFEDADVYILTSPMTASGGEEFSYNLKHHGRATLVGETTAGAGHGGGVHPVAHGYHAFVPDFRPVHPVTGRGWEGVGVVPEVACPQEEAHLVAHRIALEGLHESADPARRGEIETALAELEEASSRDRAPREFDSERMSEYVGRYGYRIILLKDDGLYLQRQGGPELKMVTLQGEDEFSLERLPQAKIRFERDGAGEIESLHVLAMSGNWERTDRER